MGSAVDLSVSSPVSGFGSLQMCTPQCLQKALRLTFLLKMR